MRVKFILTLFVCCVNMKYKVIFFVQWGLEESASDLRTIGVGFQCAEQFEESILGSCEAMSDSLALCWTLGILSVESINDMPYMQLTF